MQRLLWLLALFLLSSIIQASDSLPPAWMKRAVIYGIKPSGFVENGRYSDITKKLPELNELGINAIWLQPVFKTARGGQGYDIIDYFSLRDDLGSKEELKKLVDSAHARNIRVLFDFVPNHTSINHPFAKDIIEKGPSSVYYDYYQHEHDGAPYSSYYHKDEHGFIYYFWEDLVNLNYNNEAVRKMIADASVYWIKELNIDGYRFDAVWAVNARSPEFFGQLRKKLKSVKHEVLLLAEDKGSDPNVFKLGFDAAYDWTIDTTWVSHWPWQYKHKERENHTIFNHPDTTKRYFMLRNAIFNGNKNPEKTLRFMENNDLPRFVSSHTFEQTKMAAALLFSLPGIPLIYNGQETGVTAHPYSRQPIFKADSSIRSQDSLGLFDYYKKLIGKRLQYPSIVSKNIEEVLLEDTGSIVAFHRWIENEHFIIMLNPLPSARKCIMKADGYLSLKDVLDDEEITKSNGRFHVEMAGYSTRWLLAEKTKTKRSYQKNQ
jgi:glycosidase